MIKGLVDKINWRTPKKSLRSDYDVKIKVRDKDRKNSQRLEFMFGGTARDRLSGQYKMMRFSEIKGGASVLWFQFITEKAEGFYTISRSKGQIKVMATIDEDEKRAFYKVWSEDVPYVLYHDEGDLYYIMAKDAQGAKKNEDTGR